MIIRTSPDPTLELNQMLGGRQLHVGGPNVGSKERFLELVEGMFERNWLTNNGPLVQELEQRIGDYLGVRNCVLMANGTLALEIAIRATGMTGEVIVPSYTFIATAHALSWQGLTPVFADIDPTTHNLDPRSVERVITARTSGIIGVHLWGRGAPVTALQEISDRRGLQLIFDAAHSFSNTINQRRIGGFGRAEVFSFHATKFFSTFEGGAVTTNEDQLADSMRYMRNFGFAGLDNVTHSGTNGKMPEVCAAMGIANLENIQVITRRNKENYLAYESVFRSCQSTSLLHYDDSEANNFQYVVVELAPEVRNQRDKVVEALKASGVMARKYFWPGCHRMKPYQDLYPNAGLLLPVTEELSERIIVLPTGTTVTTNECRQIAQLLVDTIEESTHVVQ